MVNNSTVGLSINAERTTTQTERLNERTGPEIINNPKAASLPPLSLTSIQS